MRWPGGNLWFQHTPAKGRTAERGALRADRLDLAALALIADRLPLGDADAQARSAAYAPRGLVERIDASWQGSLGRAATSTRRAAASAASASPRSPAPQPAAPPRRRGRGTPPRRSARPACAAPPSTSTPARPAAAPRSSIANGALDFPGVFEEPVVPIDQLSTAAAVEARRRADVQLQVSEPALRQRRRARARRRPAGAPATRPSRAATRAFPGVLDLQGSSARADGTRVFRYLPLDIPKDTRDYVRDAVTKGSASSVDFQVKGDLHDMPFMDPKHGDFRIAAQGGRRHLRLRAAACRAPTASAGRR